MKVDPDRELVERARAGERTAFDQLVERYQRRLLRLVLRLLRDPAEAEDVVQETFLKAYRALPRFRGDAAFYTWLYRIAVNGARNAILRRRQRSGPQPIVASQAPAPPPEIGTPESMLLSKQVMQAIDAALEALPMELRTAIVLREIEGLSYEEIAQIMECPLGTVRSRIFRAREAIARRLRPLLDLPVDQRW
ncbi:RNA polymerase sigma factor RpoE [Pseudoduganella sp. DS3]|uniref:RNA polymerase sigma factor n=1 Tax=Pseudoduganella guangdongensis TaxID=2692179 RepID=A0A6N9HHS6_9BURK|nr:RNA polymerase sigma factor RpoE [Pseudoduganella guangdongensis]MYN03171.1 RNA polymerase sigma factor RpoE [Pseudoduganella guangdongensis]